MKNILLFCLFGICMNVAGQMNISADLISLWDVVTGQKIKIFSGHDEFINSVMISPDGKKAVSSDHKGIIKLWDITSGQEINNFLGSEVCFSPNSEMLLSSLGNMIILWNITTSVPVRIFSGHEKSVNSLAFNHNNKEEFFSSDIDGVIKRWDINNGNVINTFHIEKTYYSTYPVDFSPDGKFALSEDYLLDLTTNQKIITLPNVNINRVPPCFNPDGKQVLFIRMLENSKSEKALVLFDLITRQEVAFFPIDHDDIIFDIGFSPDGKKAIVCGYGSRVTLWDLNSGKNILDTGIDVGSVVSFSPDGKYFLAGLGFISSLHGR